MAKNRLINTRFWDDPFIAELDPTEKLLFLYAITNPLTDLCGAYEITLKRIAMDTGIDRDMIVKIFGRFAAADKMFYENGWLIIKNFTKHQQSNPSILKGIERSLNDCPDWIKERLYADCAQLGTPNSNSNSNKPNLPDTATAADPPAAKKAKTLHPGEKFENEVNSLLHLIAVNTGAKSRETMADPDKWRPVAESVIREQRDQDAFLAIVRSQIRETAGTRFFSAKKCLEIVQTQDTLSRNGSAPKAASIKAAIEACSLCDDGGMRDYNKPDGTFDRRDICDHK